MKRIRLIAFLFLFVPVTSVMGQTLLRGTILDSETKQPITEAKFGIINQGIGVLTNNEGKFTYRKYHHVLDSRSEFKISAPGYLNLQGNVDVLRKLQNKRGTIYLQKISEEERPIQTPLNSLTVLWDASEKSPSRSPEREITHLKRYLSTTDANAVFLVVFNETVIAKQRFDLSENGIMALETLLTSINYKGFSDYGILDVPTTDEVLLFAESKAVFGTFPTDQNIPVQIMNSAIGNESDTYFESLAAFTSGRYRKLSESENKVVLKENGPIVTGKYMNGEAPVPYAIITKKGELKEYQTDAAGNFEILASEGDILSFFALGMFPKTLTVTSKNTYTVSAVPRAEQLAEVNLKAKYKRSEYAFDSILQLDKVEGREVPVRSIHKSQFNRNAFTIGEAIDGIYGARSYYDAKRGETYISVGRGCARVFVDGYEMRVEAIPVHLVENISIYASTSMVLPCPSRIIVTTRMHPDRIDQRLRKKGYEQLKNNFYTENIQQLENNESDNTYFIKKEISGTIKGNGTLLQGVSILRRGTLNEVFTDADGRFSMKAAEGDILDIKHFGMFPKSVVVTEENEYAVDLITKAEILDEVELSKKREKADTQYDSFDPQTRMEIVNGRKYDVRTVLQKEDLNLAGIDIYETVRMSNSRIIIRENASTGQKSFVYKVGKSETLLGVMVDGFEQDPKSVNPILVERVSVYLAPLRDNSMIFITTRNHPDIRKKFLAENDIRLTDNNYNEAVEPLNQKESTYFNTQKITGIVTVKEVPLEGVNILKKGSLKEVITDRTGSFEMQASAGDILQIKHPGMYPKTVVVNEASAYKITLINKTEVLDEVAVKVKNAEEERLVTTAYADKNSKSVGYQVESELSKFVSSADISFDQVALKIPGILVDPGTKQLFFQRSFGAIDKSPIMIVLDGIPVSQSTLQTIDPQVITNITALKGVAATNKYGSQAFGGALLITTLNSEFSSTQETPDARIKNNSYQETLPTLKFDDIETDYISDVATKLSTKIKLEKYHSLKKRYRDKVDFYVNMALYFQQLDAGAARKVRNDFALLAKDNVKALRILAYLNEHAREFMQAQKVYEKVLEMAPDEPQSYRDLALVYQESGEYEKSFELYLSMLGNQIPGVDFTSLTSVLSNELQRLINLHKHKVEYQRLPNDWLVTNFSIDVRMTASWSDTNAPFEFQFVNPKNRFYNWNSDDSTPSKQPATIAATEEFVIDDAQPGKWLINVRYTGDENASNIPPYLKYTVYKNFGTAKEQRLIKLVKLNTQIQKVTLDSFNYSKT